MTARSETFCIVDGEMIPTAKSGRCGWLGCEDDRLQLVLLFGEGTVDTEYIYLCDVHAARFMRQMNGEE